LQTFLTTVVFTFTVLVASFVKGLTGFGSALIIVPIFALFLPLENVVHAIALPLALSNVPMALTGWKNLSKRTFIPASVSFAVGIATGSNLLSYVSDGVLRNVLGVVLVFFSIFQLMGGRQVLKSPQITPGEVIRLSSLCIISGVVAGLVGIGGIPLVIYLSFRYPKDEFRHLANYTFLLGAFVQVLVFTVRGFYTPDTLQLSLWLILPTFIGFWLGAQFAGRVSQRTFNRVMGALLLIPALNLIF
jgi:uncharacterized protein